MQIRTLSTTLPVSPERAFGFLSQLANVPRWATEFVTGDFDLRGDHAIAETAQGPVAMRIRADADTGVIDILGEVAPGVHAVFPTRVLPFPGEESRSIYLFTLAQGRDQPDEAFEAGLASLQRELDNLPGLFGSSGGATETRLPAGAAADA